MDNRRAAYNHEKYAIQKQRDEELKRFAELYPERYAQLVAKVKAEGPIVKTEIAPYARPVASLHPTDVPNVLKKFTWPISKEDLDSILLPLNERHVYLHTHDEWNKIHLNFESIVFPNEDIDMACRKVLTRRYPSYTLESIELCTCSACLRRHPNN